MVFCMIRSVLLLFVCFVGFLESKHYSKTWGKAGEVHAVCSPPQADLGGLHR